MDEEIMESNSDSDSDLSSTEDDKHTVELSKRAEELESSLENNINLYDSLKELVELYQKLGELKSLRMAYERFSNVFPLTSELWLNWINVEKSIASSKDDTQFVLQLFDKAVKDYLSISLWEEYIQYAIGQMSVVKVRELFQSALLAGGLHVGDGRLLWDTIRVFEMAHLSLIEDNSSEEWHEQIKKIIEYFHRQLAVPLLGMEETHREWINFCDTIETNHSVDRKAFEWIYKKAHSVLDKYKPFEVQLASTFECDQKLSIYQDYIKIVEDPSAKMCLYERMVCDLCLVPNVWLDYCTYTIPFGDCALNISQKSTRNCPWSQDIWILRLRLLEHFKKDTSDVMKCFEKAVENLGTQCVDLWLTYLDYTNRNCKENLSKLFEQASGQVPDNLEKILKLQAKFCAKNDIVTARFLWKKILNHSSNRTLASVWLELVNLEKLHGDVKQTRSVFERAISQCKDWPYLIAEEWKLFERENGTVEDLIKCEEKCRPILSTNQQIQPAEVTIKSTKTETIRKRKVVETIEETPQKRFKRNTNFIVSDPERTVFVSNLQPSVDERHIRKIFPNAEDIQVIYDKRGISRCYGYIQFSRAEEAAMALARDREILENRPLFISECKTDRTERNKEFKYSTSLEDKKLFVKNIPFKTTQEELENVFKPLGAIDVRLVMSKAGRSKGIAYVEFSDTGTAFKVMQNTNNTKIGESVISVAISAPPSKQKSSVPSYSSTQTSSSQRHSKSRLHMPLLPRAVTLSKPNPPPNGSGTSIEKKTNADFRNMLLNR